jgi:hypothetical protein
MKAVLPWVKVLLMGYVAVLMAHQALLALLNAMEWVSTPAYDLSPVPPIGIPAVVMTAFFGGLWALPLWALLKAYRGPQMFIGAALFGAVLPTLVAMLLIGLPTAPMTWMVGALLNGAWGLGVAVLMWLFNTAPEASPSA